ncbi:HAMP domain-containing histidine kinase [bacterium]|nr:HAMP domain-containing histidine kinase [bacterium]MBU1074117.1 HAMP domain-containing histidine kinase [bacterium]MBU1676469.1 HAMP domain-containing histidine kinase [bacterium]
MKAATYSPAPATDESTQFVSAASLRLRSDWFIKMRWGAAAGVAALTLLAGEVAHIPLPREPILATAAVLILLNVVYAVRNRRVAPAVIAHELRVVKVQMLIDLLLLTVLINLSGGLENPFSFIYVVHVLIASLLFKGRDVYQVALFSAVLFSFDILGEHFGLLPHNHLQGGGVLTHAPLYMAVSLASFWLVLFGCAYVGASIMRHNRTIKNELVARQRQLVAADKAKLDFFRFVSHEVKTPVVTAQSAVEAVLGVAGGEMSAKAAETLRRAVRRLNQALEIVKDLSDLTRTRMSADRDVAEVNLSRLVGKLLAEQGELIAEKGLVQTTALPPEDLVMQANETMIEKIFDNLISNAVRYDIPGGALRVSLLDLGDSVRLSVADEGIGVAPEDRDRIFDEFYRTPAAKEMSALGTGLGLSIVKRFTEQLGGSLQLDSTPGTGSTFTVTLPKS